MHVGTCAYVPSPFPSTIKCTQNSRSAHPPLTPDSQHAVGVNAINNWCSRKQQLLLKSSFNIEERSSDGGRVAESSVDFLQLATIKKQKGCCVVGRRRNRRKRWRRRRRKDLLPLTSCHCPPVHIFELRMLFHSTFKDCIGKAEMCVFKATNKFVLLHFSIQGFLIRWLTQLSHLPISMRQPKLRPTVFPHYSLPPHLKY